MYYKVTAYDNFIAYARTTFVVVDMNDVLNYLVAKELWHAKIHRDFMFRALQPRGCTIFYLIRLNLVFIVFSLFYFNHAVCSSAIPQAC